MNLRSILEYPFGVLAFLIWISGSLGIFLIGIRHFIHSKQEQSRKKQIFAWVMVGVSILLILQIDLTNFPFIVFSGKFIERWDEYVALFTLPAFLLFSHSLIAGLKPEEKLTAAYITQNKKGSVLGLLIYGLFLALSLYIYGKNYYYFGSDYTRMRWEYFNDESMTNHALWAFGFLLPFNFSFSPLGFILPLGLLAPILFGINGITWLNGRKLHAFFLSMQLCLLYIYLPIFLAYIVADP